MKFDWSEISENEFARYCKERDYDLHDELNTAMNRAQWCEDDMIGCVRVGELAFDLRLYHQDADDEGSPLVLWLEGYAGGVGGDNAYAYSVIDDGYPYEFVGYTSIEDDGIWMSYTQFQEFVETRIKRFILEENDGFTEADLTALAEMPLHVW